MPAFTHDEALAFIEAISLNLEGKTGFKWFVERLSVLAEYIKSVASENAQLNAFIDETGARQEYEAFREGNQDSNQ